MKKLSVFLIVVLLMSGILPVQGQEDFNICDPAGALPAVEQLVGQLDPSSEESWVSSVIQLRTLLGMIEQSCLGLPSYNSETFGLQPVLDPVVIPAGVYRVTFTTSGFGIVDVEPLEGSCSSDRFTTNLFNVFEEAEGGVQATFRSEGCLALISVSNTREPWTLDFEALSLQ